MGAQEQHELIERAAEEVERAQAKSKQPRFSAANAESFFGAVHRWITSVQALEQPDYKVRSEKRDTWLMNFWQLEPHLAGVLNSVLQIDTNRGWTLTGGRNQVYRYTRVFHDYYATPDLVGWRPGISTTAMSFYATDLGGIIELGRDGKNGPLRAFYCTDSTRCHLTGNVKTPLTYRPPSGATQQWRGDDYFRVVSMPSANEQYRGLGFCAVSRCVDLAKIMVGIYQHDQEMVGARMPKGLLLLQGISEEQWETAMEAREAKEDSLEREYFGGVFTLATAGLEQIDAKLVALSQLPDNFDIKTFTDLLMYGYALAFGYDPTEFWPVQFGALGRGRESEVQAAKATGKGGLAFALSFQEQLQELLPDTLQFEFEQRDQEAAIQEAHVALAWANVARTLYEAGQMGGGSLLQREQALTLLVNAGVIPPEWTETEEEVETTDTEARMRHLQEQALTLPAVQRAIARYPNEPIVRYHWPSGRETVLWRRGVEALSRNIWRGVNVSRQDDDDDEVLWEGDGVTITQADVERAIEEGGRRVGPEFEQLLRAPTDPTGEESGERGRFGVGVWDGKGGER